MRFRYDKRALQRMREERGLTRGQIAKLARLTERTLSFLERGVTEPRASTIAKLSGALGTTPADFFTGDAA